MGVVKGERKESKVEFDNTYFKVFEDAVRLCKCNFGCKEETLTEYLGFILSMKTAVMESVNELGRCIRIANSIYPTCEQERQLRRINQDKAIGLCFDLITKYQLIMKLLKINDNKFLTDIKHIEHEINCLKSWRSSDNKRFKNLG